MSLRLVRVGFREYAQAVMPLTRELWGGGLALEDYVERSRRFAESGYGRKHYRILALADEHGSGEVLASCKWFAREARLGSGLLHAIGIGAVFTPQERRGAGHATALLGLILDEARAAGTDFAFLYSDIHPQFYRQLGFVDLPSRTVSARADALGAGRLRIESIGSEDWTHIRTCFDAMESARTFGFTRAPLFWNSVRLRAEQGDNFLIRGAHGVEAYVLGRREPKHDAYVVDEIAYAGEDARPVAEALLRAAAGDLQRVSGWLPPLPARRILPRGSVRARTSALLMAAPLSSAGTRFVQAASERSSGDPCWKHDHV